jgi:hypothetical protein
MGILCVERDSKARPKRSLCPTPQYNPVTPCRYLDTNQVPDNCTQDDVVPGVSAMAYYVRGMTHSAAGDV